MKLPTRYQRPSGQENLGRSEFGNVFKCKSTNSGMLHENAYYLHLWPVNAVLIGQKLASTKPEPLTFLTLVTSSGLTFGGEN